MYIQTAAWSLKSMVITLVRRTEVHTLTRDFISDTHIFTSLKSIVSMIVRSLPDNIKRLEATVAVIYRNINTTELSF